MADIALSVVTGFGVTESVTTDKKSPRVVVCIANDLDVVDGRVTIQVTRRGPGTYDALQGTIVTAGDNTQILIATRTMVTERDLQQANSFFRVGDVKFRVAANDCEFPPLQGDHLFWDGLKHEVLGVDVMAMGTSYLMWTRRV